MLLIKRTITKLSNLITSGKEPTIEYKSGGEAHAMAQIVHSFAETYSLKAGLKKFKEKGKVSVLKEMSQLHNRKCWVPRKLEKLTPLQIKRAMRSVIFLTEKRDGTIKTRNCIDGSSMRVWMPKDHTASPTVGLGSLMSTCVIDAKENRDAATVDVPNAFIQTDLTGETVIMKIKGELVGF